MTKSSACRVRRTSAAVERCGIDNMQPADRMGVANPNYSRRSGGKRGGEKTSAGRGRWWRAALLLGQEAIGRANMLVSHVCRWLRSHNVHRLRPHDLVLRRQRFHSQPVQVVMPCSCASIGSRSCHLRDSGEDESNVSSEMFVGPSAQTTRCEMSVLAAYLLPSPNVMGCSLGVAAAAQPRSVAIICSPA